jgi:cyclase
MDRDGARSGFDLRSRVPSGGRQIPVIASGAWGRCAPRRRHRRGADAVLAASIFHYGEFTIGEAKGALAAAGIEVR